MIITTYLTSSVDPQRGIKWKPNVEDIKVIDSVECVVLNDCFDFTEYKGSKFVRVESNGNPYFERWRLIGEYLTEGGWCVDATDVELIGELPEFEKGVLYCGLDRGTCQSKWLKKNHPYDFTHLGDKPLLNCGVVGGDYQVLKSLCEALKDGKGNTDMGVFNLYAHTQNVVYEKVCTPFKEYRKTDAIWMHK